MASSPEFGGTTVSQKEPTGVVVCSLKNAAWHALGGLFFSNYGNLQVTLGILSFLNLLRWQLVSANWKWMQVDSNESCSHHHSSLSLSKNDGRNIPPNNCVQRMKIIKWQVMDDVTCHILFCGNDIIHQPQCHVCFFDRSNKDSPQLKRFPEPTEIGCESLDC